MQLNTIFNNLGFSKNESIVYLATLEMGFASAQEIAKKSKLKRTTVYSILQSLAIKGLVIISKEKRKNKFIAENPKNIATRFFNYQQDLERSLPELEAIYNKKQTKPKVLFFEGTENIKKIYLDTIESKPEIILEFNTSEFQKTFSSFSSEYVNLRKLNNINAKRIAPNNIRWIQHKKHDKNELSETKLLPEKEFKLPIEINIYNNKVAFMSYIDNFGLIIESEGITKAMKIIYEIFWSKI